MRKKRIQLDREHKGPYIRQMPKPPLRRDPRLWAGVIFMIMFLAFLISAIVLQPGVQAGPDTLRPLYPFFV